MSYYQQFRPENALPKAIDLEKVGKPQDAYNLLNQSLTNKSRSKVWSNALEDSVLKLIELSIKLRASTADLRNVLSNFKASTLGNSAGAVNPGSFAKAIRYLISCAEGATLPTIAQSLEGEEEVAAKTVQENRFLWEVYRTALELVKNNYKTFALYHEVLYSVFNTCKTYNRPAEFRRFTIVIRDNHSSTAQIVNQLTDEEQIQEVYITSLKTRLAQLDTAYKLEVWSETSNTVMDIHDLVKSIPQITPALAPVLAVILNHLSNYFWSSRNFILHAYSLWRLYHIVINNPDQSFSASLTTTASVAGGSLTTQWHTAEPSTILAGIYLSSILADSFSKTQSNHSHITAPLKGENYLLCPAKAPNGDAQSSKYNALFGLSNHTEPSTSHLLSTLPPLQPFSNAIPAYVERIFHTLRQSVSPLKLTRVITPYLEQMQSDSTLAMYTKDIETAVIRTVTFGVAQLYNTISIDKFKTVIPQTNWADVEHLLTRLSIDNELFLLINHHNSTLAFTPPPKQYAVYTHSIASALSHLSRVITPLIDPNQKIKNDNREKAKVSFADNIQTDIRNIRDKHSVLVAKREEIDRKFREEEERKQFEAQQALEEKQRVEEERRIQEEQRLAKQKEEDEERERQLEKKQQIIDALSKSVQTAETQDLRKNKDFRRAAALTEKDGASERELIEAARQLETQKRQEAQRIKVEERKTLDYLVRAQRDAQRAKLLATYDDEVKRLDNIFDKRVETARQKHKEDYDVAIVRKKTLAVIEPDRQAYREKVLAVRREKLAEEMKQYEIELEAYNIEKARLEEEQRAREEEERQAREEQRRLEAEEAARVAAELEAEEERRRAAERPAGKKAGTSWLLKRAQN